MRLGPWATMTSMVVVLIAILVVSIQSGKLATSASAWNLTYDEESSSLAVHKDRCNIPFVDEEELTLQEFVDRYWRKQPFILQRSTHVNRPAQEWTTKQALWQRVVSGDDAASIPLASTQAYAFRGEKRSTLVDYLSELDRKDSNNSNSSFAFGRDFLDVGRHYVPPTILSSPDAAQKLFGGIRLDDKWHYQVAIAAHGAGLPFHWHADVFAEVLHGQRRWFLYPPEHSPVFNPRATSATWLEQVYSNATFQTRNEFLMECTLFPNQAIYVPNDWFHSTVSLGQAVSITTSFADLQRLERYQLQNGHHAYMLDALEARDFVTATQHAQALRQLRPQNFAPYAWLGVIYTLHAQTMTTADDMLALFLLARKASTECIELNPLYAPCRVWLARQLEATSILLASEQDGRISADYKRQAVVMRQIAGELSSEKDDEILDPRWQPKQKTKG